MNILGEVEIEVHCLGVLSGTRPHMTLKKSWDGTLYAETYKSRGHTTGFQVVTEGKHLFSLTETPKGVQLTKKMFNKVCVHCPIFVTREIADYLMEHNKVSEDRRSGLLRGVYAV